MCGEGAAWSMVGIVRENVRQEGTLDKFGGGVYPRGTFVGMSGKQGTYGFKSDKERRRANKKRVPA